MRLDLKVATTLNKHKQTLATAESCTGGLLAHTLTNIPGASSFFYMGLVSYDNSAKTALLKIPSSLLKKHGAVSPEVAMAMAAQVRKILKTDYGIGITGIAGPTGATKTKPIGLVYIGVSNAQHTIVSTHHFDGSRLSIKRQAVQAALKTFLSIVSP